MGSNLVSWTIGAGGLVRTYFLYVSLLGEMLDLFHNCVKNPASKIWRGFIIDLLSGDVAIGE